MDHKTTAFIHFIVINCFGYFWILDKSRMRMTLITNHINEFASCYSLIIVKQIIIESSKMLLSNCGSSNRSHMPRMNNIGLWKKKNYCHISLNLCLSLVLVECSIGHGYTDIKLPYINYCPLFMSTHE